VHADRGTIDGVQIRCVPAAVQAHRIRRDRDWMDDHELRDALLLREHAGIALPDDLRVNRVRGAIPPAEVAAAYLAWHDRVFPGPGTEMLEDGDPDDWARELVTVAVEHTPDHAWDLILALVAAASSERHQAFIAAGPLEDYLSNHGEAVIERVEAQAAADPRFRHVLAGVWQLSMSNEVYARVREAAGHELW
jgi:hypothetical protein